MPAQRPFKKILAGTIAVLAISLTAVTINLWHRGVIQKWIRAQIVAFYVKKVQPNIPFTIEEADFEATWRELWHGTISRLSLKIRWAEIQAVIDGPIKISRIKTPEQENLEIAYLTQTSLKKIGDSETATPFYLELNALLPANLRGLDKISAVIASDQFIWKSFGIDAKQLQVHVESRDRKTISAQVSLESLGLEPNPALQLRIPGLQSQIEGNIQDRLTAHLEAQDGELLKGEDYYSLPLKEFPLEAVAEFESALKPKLLRAELGKTTRLNFEWRGTEMTAQGSTPSLATLVALAESALSKKLLPESIEAKGGKLTFNARAKTVPVQDYARFSPESVTLAPSSVATLENLALRDRAGLWILPRISLRATPRQIQVQSLPWQLRHWKASLAPLTIDFDHTPQSLRIKIRGPQYSLIQSANFPFTLTELDGAYDFSSKELELNTSLKIPKTPWETFRQAFCLSTLKGLPAEIEVNFDPLRILNDAFDPTGAVRASLFGGWIQLSEFGIYHYLSDVPEFDFDLRIQDVQMDEVGRWTGFGEMDGILEVDVKDGVMQGWLPTQYEALAQIRPHRHDDIVFSAEAMKNTVRLFAAEAMNQIPSIAQWFAFGWPSRIFGGYDIQYAGLKLSSQEAQITLETLDPPEIVAKEGLHFFLYGPRFKMPLRSFHYPLVVDATAMGNFIRQITLTLKEIVRNKAKDAKKPEQEKITDESKLEFGDCQVPPL